MPLTTSQLRSEVATRLAWLSEHGFRYRRSDSQFRREDTEGYSYITLSAVTHNRVDYHLAFYLGVRIDSLEVAIRNIRDETAALNHDDRSLHHYTVNTGPTNHGWRQPFPGTWTLRDSSEIDSMEPSIRQYLLEVGLPFINESRTGEAVRDYLIKFPSHTQNPYPWRQILGADVLARDRDRLDADFEALSVRYARFVPHLRRDFEAFYSAAGAAIETQAEQAGASDGDQPAN